MAEEATGLQAVIGKLQQINPEIHWCCPRNFKDDIDTYDDQDAEDSVADSNQVPNVDKQNLISESQKRLKMVLRGLHIFAMLDAERVQEWMKAKLDIQLKRCDLCIRNFHKEKRKFQKDLIEEFDETSVTTLIMTLDELDFRRIKAGLSSVSNTLESLPPAQRKISALEPWSLFAIVEALSCPAFYKDEDALKSYFDKTLALANTRKLLLVGFYMPATTCFLFDSNEGRRVWAMSCWSKGGRSPTREEFDWAIYEPLLDAMKQLTSPTGANENFRIWFWIGAKLILESLSPNLITHSLRAMEIDICRLSIDELRHQSPVVRVIISFIHTMLIKAPGDFWDAMGSISPTTVIEQIFSSPYFGKLLAQAKPDDDTNISGLDDLLSWMAPLMTSLKLQNQPPACRALITQLMEHLQTNDFPAHIRALCFEKALELLLCNLRSFVENGPSINESVRRVVVSETLEITGKHIRDILNVACLTSANPGSAALAKTAMGVIRNALTLDCQSLQADHLVLEAGGALQNGKSTYSRTIWEEVSNKFDQQSLELARNTLIGITPLVGLERFKVLSTADPPEVAKDKRHFNETYGHLAETVSHILGRLSEFKPDVLDGLFAETDTAGPLIAALVAADSPTYDAAIEIIKAVSGESGRREAISHLLVASFRTTTLCFAWTVRKIGEKKTFAACPRMLTTIGDVLDIMCNAQDGILRSISLKPGLESQSVTLLWKYLWKALSIIFELTEKWGRLNDKAQMIEFCRDTMQFAEKLFDQHSIISSAIEAASPNNDPSVTASQKNLSGKNLLDDPARTMGFMVRWLRLRDEFLATTSVSLVCKILRRLGNFGTVIETDALRFVEEVAISGFVRTNLTDQEKAELKGAFYYHQGKHEKSSARGSAPLKQAKIDGWANKSTVRGTTEVIDLESEYKTPKTLAQPITISDDENLETFKSEFFSSAAKKFQDLQDRRRQVAEKTAKDLKAQQEVTANKANAFKKKREEERAAKRKRDMENAAFHRRNQVQQTSLDTMGVLGKDHAPPISQMMVSESDSDDADLDAELFGELPKAQKVSAAVKDYNEARLIEKKRADLSGPVKKPKIARSAKDMRARLAPDLSSLHKTILSWDFFHTGNFPPNSDCDDYSLVTNEFRTPNDYQATFQPLLILEAWQGFLKAKEESSFKPFQIKVSNRMTVDAFFEVSTIVSVADGREVGISEADIVLMSKSKDPAHDSLAHHCLARVWKISRKKAEWEVTYRLTGGGPLVASISPKAILHGIKILSITPLEREYGALLGLQYFDLCNEIIKARPSPILPYRVDQLQPLMRCYNINNAQARAVRSAIDNDAFTLIQGPPGSGKTMTIVAIIGAVLSRRLMDKGTAIARPTNPASYASSAPLARKLLVCAPSNAAVDELVTRLKKGVKTLSGEHMKVSVIRIGRSESINLNVIDVTLEELVSKRLNINTGKETPGEEMHKLIEEHKSLSAALDITRDKLNESRMKNEQVSELQRQFDNQKRQRTSIGLRLDNLRDNAKTASRDAEISRRRVQQEILNGADVICATLSGSGHDMFQHINIEFETVIIDEAAQSIELSALIPLKYGCSKCILVGDPKQLPPTVLSREASRFQYEQSLFVRMQINHPKDVHLLDTQYRMHPEISLYPSKTFYDGKLLDGEGMAKKRHRPWHTSKILGPYRFFDVEGQQSNTLGGHSLINVAELNIAMQLYQRVTTDYPECDLKGKVGIITPYKSQLRELKKCFGQKYGEEIFKNVEFNTTDAYQGRESEIIIFSCVRASSKAGIGFLADIRRMNVGLTRAKASLWVLGNSKSLLHGEFWGGLIRDAKARDRYTSGNLPALLDQTTREREDVEMIDIDMVNSLSIAVPTPPAGTGILRDKSMEKYYAARLKSTGNGLNHLRYCDICASPSHIATFCDNESAKQAAYGKCERCFQPGHGENLCKSTICLTCGSVGHNATACTSNKPLPRNLQFELRSKEAAWQRRKQQSIERVKARQTGDHDPKVPTIKTTRRTPPLEENGKVIKNKGTTRGGLNGNGSGSNLVGTRNNNNGANPHGPRNQNNRVNKRRREPSPSSALQLIKPSKGLPAGGVWNTPAERTPAQNQAGNATSQAPRFPLPTKPKPPVPHARAADNPFIMPKPKRPKRANE